MFEIAEKRNSEHVYDLKGNTYVYWGEKTSEGYLCQEIYQVGGYSYDMPPYDELGNVVVLKEIYKEPCIPVDTHVIRVSKRLGLVNEIDSPAIIEQKLNELIPKNQWSRVGDQILLFGRYHCLAKNPKCDGCLFKKECKKISD